MTIDLQLVWAYLYYVICAWMMYLRVVDPEKVPKGTSAHLAFWSVAIILNLILCAVSGPIIQWVIGGIFNVPITLFQAFLIMGFLAPFRPYQTYQK